MGQGETAAVKVQRVDSCVLAPAVAGPLHFQPAYDTERSPLKVNSHPPVSPEFQQHHPG